MGNEKNVEKLEIVITFFNSAGFCYQHDSGLPGVRCVW